MEIFTPDLWGKLLVGGLSTATGCVAYFARQIIRNQQDLLEVKHMLSDVRKELCLAKKGLYEAKSNLESFEESQNRSHAEITSELSKLSILTEFCKWDGVERRSN